MDAERKLCVFSMVEVGYMLNGLLSGLDGRLPPALTASLEVIGPQQLQTLEEIRVRAGRHVELVFAERSQELHLIFGKREMEGLIAALTGQSLYAYERQMAQGFIPLPGGHRVGLCGRAVLAEEKVIRLTDISSVVLRVARRVDGASQNLRPYLRMPEGRVARTLVMGPPGCGKTTILRDAALWLSDACGLHVAVADEKEELFAQELPANMGKRIDVLSGAPKAQTMLTLIRTMRPDVLVTDEIGRQEDVFALMEAARCGVALLASVHAEDIEDLKRRPALSNLLREMCFDRYVRLEGRGKTVRAWDTHGRELREANHGGQLGSGSDGDDRGERDRLFDRRWRKGAASLYPGDEAVHCAHQ